MQHANKNRGTLFLIGFAAWTLMGLFTSAIRVLQQRDTPFEALATVLLGYYLMGLLSIPVWFWVTRVLGPRGIWMKVAGHLVGAATYALVWYAFYHALYPLVMGWEAYRAEPFQLYYLFLIDDAVKSYVLITIAYAAWQYHQNRQEARRLAAEQEARNRQMQLTVLKTQLNPHFLFNSLNSVNALVASDPEQARTVLAALGDTLRYSLESDQKATVLFEQERQFTETYLHIEQARFGDRLQATWDIHPESRAFPVPPMILQPLVENAVRHGIAPLPEGGGITISAHVHGDQLEITVSDDGVGITNDRDALLNKGRGLHHTHQRLRAQYPGNTGLHIARADNGFSAAFFIPRGSDDSETGQVEMKTVAEPVHA